ncbi:MAG: aldehyde ferredoxin oxidoreductase C-terminal domain-containing protein [Promethearchaeota archaeon]
MKLLRVDVDGGSVRSEPVPEKYEYCGGRSLSSRIVADEVDPLGDPLGPGAKLVLATGLLTGTPAPCSARLSVGGKSPLTGGIKEANVGGRASYLLARSGIRGVVIEGQSREPHCLVVREGEGELVPCPELAGLGNYEVTGRLLAKYGESAATVTVGPAGERGLRAATVAVNDLQGYPSRHAARGGLGAVMGSRGLKAVVVVPPKHPTTRLADRPAFMSLAGELARNLSRTKAAFSRLGTAIMVNAMNEYGGLPTRNFRAGTFEGAEKISGETLNNLIVDRGGRNRLACSPGCAIRCSNLFVDADGEHVTSSLEYETISLCGSNLMVDDLDVLARIDHLCDDIGVDTIDIGGAVGVAMEAGLLEWGDGEAVLSLIGEIRGGTEKGTMLGNGAKFTGEKLGVSRVAQVKGQGLPAYDPRVFKAMGVTFATSPMGADHTAGAAIAGRKARADVDYGGLSDKEMKVELSRDLQVFTMTMDSVGFCYFVGPSYENQQLVADLLNAAYGWSLSREDVIATSRGTLDAELDFNRRAGIGREANHLPRFFREEPSDPTGNMFDVDGDALEKIWDEIERE